MSDPNGRNADNGITGNSFGWIAMSFSLAAFEGQWVWLGFRYNTDEGTTNEGVYVDEVQLVKSYATSTVLSSSIAGTAYPVAGKPNGSYWYVARGLDAEGDWGYASAPREIVVSLATTVVSGPAAERFSLDASRPNPFSRTTSIRFSLPAAGEHALIVYDVAGRKVRTLSRGSRPAGPAEAVWDGRDDGGIFVPSGVYFYRLETPAGRLEKRMVLRR
jgi:hypothetical protein